MSRRRSKPRLRSAIGVLLLSSCLACDALGNPPQRVTPPEVWVEGNDKITTTSQSFSDSPTIERLLHEGLGDLDYVDRAVRDAKTLTFVTAVPGLRERRRRNPQELVTLFEFANGRKIERRWWVQPGRQKWKAAFALPEPPKRAVTALAPIGRRRSP